MWRKLRKKSFFMRFLVSYFLVLLIPLVTILLSYARIEVFIKDKVMESSRTNLYQFFSTVDNTLSEMSETAQTAFNNTYIRTIADQRTVEAVPSSAKRYARQQLSAMSQRHYLDLFVYYHPLDLVVSGNFSVLDSEMYFQAYYQKSIDRTTFSQLLHPNQPYQLQLSNSSNSSTNSALTLSLQQNFQFLRNQQYNATVVAILRPEYMKQLFQNATFQQAGTIAIANAHGDLVAASNPAMTGAVIDTDDNAPTTQIIDGQEYLVQTFPSRVTEGVYVSAVPTSIFWQEITTIRIALLIVFLICVVLCVFAAYFVAQHLYTPVPRLIDTIKSYQLSPEDTVSEDEFEFIQSSLAHVAKENRHLFQQLQENQADWKRNRLLRLLQAEQPEENAQVLAEIGFPLRGPCVQVILLRLEQVDTTIVGPLESSHSGQLIHLILENVLCELYDPHSSCQLIPQKPLEYALLINFSEQFQQPEEWSLEILSKANSFFSTHFGMLLTFGISEVIPSLEELQTAYTDAVYAMSYRYNYGKGSAIKFSLVSQRSFAYRSIAASKAEHIMPLFIKDPPPTNTSPQIVSDLILALGVSSDDSIDTLDAFRYDISNHIGLLVSELGAEQLAHTYRFRHILLHAETHKEFTQQLEHILTLLWEFVRGQEKEHPISKQADEIILQHFSNPALNLNMISEMVELSPAYLSRLYREEKQMSLVDYLQQVRIAHAKHLLSQGEDTIELVATQSGFLSSSIFIRTFKKWEGTTPGAYRKLKE